MEKLVIIPTYNEKDNVESIIGAVFALQQNYHILIIDDAIGSGATINEIAVKIKDKKLANKITGLAITGSYKGFEVISEL